MSAHTDPSSGVEINVTTAIDDARLGALQVRVVGLCAIVAMLDGFDTQSIAFVAPVIAEQWSLERSAFGPLFSAGLVGLLAGQLVLGPLADRHGRKRIIVLSTMIFGFFTLLTAQAGSWHALLLLRFLTGIGLGGAMPNIVALTSEYVPVRLRATAITTMFCGFPLGAMIGGFVSARLIPEYDWQSVFVVGGALPLLLVPVLIVALPESIRFLVAVGASDGPIRRHLSSIAPTLQLPAGAKYVLSESTDTRSRIRQLFVEGRGVPTLLLWLSFFMNLLLAYVLVNWLPLVLKQASLSLDTAIRSVIILNAGGVVGAIVLGRLIDKFNACAVLGVSFAMAGVFVLLIGLGAGHAAALALAVFLSGFCIMGGQIGMNALAAGFYPTSIRSTGVGWALGIGRIGAVVGPVLAGGLAAVVLDIRLFFAVAAAPAFIASMAVFLLARPISRRS